MPFTGILHFSFFILHFSFVFVFACKGTAVGAIFQRSSAYIARVHHATFRNCLAVRLLCAAAAEAPPGAAGGRLRCSRLRPMAGRNEAFGNALTVRRLGGRRFALSRFLSNQGVKYIVL